MLGKKSQFLLTLKIRNLINEKYIATLKLCDFGNSKNVSHLRRKSRDVDDKNSQFITQES